ncbi:hypothetical protein H0O02_04070 [Candidatus Micrarchaeota archaeon]|nr:hypothetical protein [Candidatus Micrarchaeota archaeon]
MNKFSNAGKEIGKEKEAPKGPPPLKQEPKAEPPAAAPGKVATPIEPEKKTMTGMPQAIERAREEQMPPSGGAPVAFAVKAKPPEQNAEPQRQAPALTLPGAKARAPDVQEDKNQLYALESLQALVGMHGKMQKGDPPYNETLVVNKVWETYEYVMKVKDPKEKTMKLCQLASLATRFGTDFKSDALFSEGRERFAEALAMAERIREPDLVANIKIVMERRGLLEKPEEKKGEDKAVAAPEAQAEKKAEEKVVLAPEVQAEVDGTQRTSKPPLSPQDEKDQRVIEDIRKLTKNNKFAEAWKLVGRIKGKAAKWKGIEEIADAYERKGEFKEALNAAKRIKDSLVYARVLQEIAQAQIATNKPDTVLAARKTLKMAKDAIIDESESQEKKDRLADISKLQGDLEGSIKKTPAYNKMDKQLTRKKWYRGVGATFAFLGTVGLAIFTDAYGRDIADWVVYKAKYGFADRDAAKKDGKSQPTDNEKKAIFDEATSKRVDAVEGRIGAIEVQLPLLGHMTRVYADVDFSRFKDGRIRAVKEIDKELKAAEKTVGSTYIELKVAKTVEGIDSELAVETDAARKAVLENEKKVLLLGQEKDEREKLNNYLELDRQGLKNQLCTTESGNVAPLIDGPMCDGPVYLAVKDANGKIKVIPVYNEKQDCPKDCKGGGGEAGMSGYVD